MDWIIVSLASAAAFAVVSVLDKTVLNRYVPSSSTFIVLAGLLQLPSSVIALLIVPLQSYSLEIWSASIISGFLLGASLAIMFWVLGRQEVSRVIPVYQTSPVFVAVLAVLFLAEKLTALHWVAIMVTVSGAALLSLRRSHQSQR